MIPLPYKILFVIAALAFYTGLVFKKGMDYVQGKWDAADAVAKVAALTTNIRQHDGTEKELIRYVDRVVEVEKRVPVVRRVLDERCLRDDSPARPVVPGGAAGTNEAGRGARDDSQFAERLSAVINACGRDAARQDALIGWVNANSYNRK